MVTIANKDFKAIFRTRIIIQLNASIFLLNLGGTLIGRETLLGGGVETTLDKKNSFKLVSFFELVLRRGIEDTA